MCPSRFVRSVLLALMLLGAARPSRADDATELERAKTSYDAGRYAEGMIVRQLLTPDAPQSLKEPATIERARAYYAACLIALGRSGEADSQIERIIRENPLYSPNPVVFPGKVIDRFIDVKSRMRSEIEDAFRARADAERKARVKVEQEQRAYMDGLQRMAAQERSSRDTRVGLPWFHSGPGSFRTGKTRWGTACWSPNRCSPSPASPRSSFIPSWWPTTRGTLREPSTRPLLTPTRTPHCM